MIQNRWAMLKTYRPDKAGEVGIYVFRPTFYKFHINITKFHVTNFMK